MSNNFVSKTDVAEQILINFQYDCPIISTSWREYEERIIGDSWDLGGTLQVPLPVRYLVNDGATINSVPDVVEKYTSLQLNYRKNVPMSFTTQEMTINSRYKFEERFIDPASSALAIQTEAAVAEEMFMHTYLVTGTAGVAPSAYSNIANLRGKMKKMGIPFDKRWLLFDEDSYQSIISAGTLQNSFDKDLTKDINREAQLGRIAQFQSFSSALLYDHIAGIGDSTATPANGLVACGSVKTTVTNGNTIVLTGLHANDTGVFVKGDKIIFDGVFHAAPISLKNTGIPFSVVVTDTSVNTDASGECTIHIEPEIISDYVGAVLTPSPYRNISNVNGLLATTTAKLVTGNTGAGSVNKIPYKLNFGYIPEAILFAAPPLAYPEGIPKEAVARVIDKETKTSIRLYAFTAGLTDTSTHRLDVLFGVKIMGDRIMGLLG